MQNGKAESGATGWPLPIRLSVSPIQHSAFSILHLFHDCHVQPLVPPLDRLIVGGEEDVDVAALDRAAAVDDLDGLGAVVTGNLEPRAEREQVGVGGDERAAVIADPAAAGGQAAGGTAAAL